MKRNFYLTAVLLISFTGYSQTYDQYAIGYFNTGCKKVADKNYKGAIADFSDAIKHDPGFKQAYENRGVAKYYLQDFKGAISDYTKALEIDPEDYTTYGRRGWAEFSLNDYRAAIDDLDKAVKGSKDMYRYCNFRGEAKFKLGDSEGAIADFSSVIRSWSAGKEQKGKAFYWRGMIELSLGQNESGCLDLHKAGKSGYAQAYEVIKTFCE
jgi:tetratricopeptide (TPR) repeat protein